MQHDPAIWGDPEVFRPERWLEGSDIDRDDAGGVSLARKGTGGLGSPRGAELKKYLFTFGMGPRACIGKK
jgi:benzoate 4-monooxygenase